jgi:adenosine tuberculosinyltransferase
MKQPEQPVPTLEEFQSWPAEKVAERVRQDGSKVCVFPINGTRRWFALEYPEQATTKFTKAYLQISGRRHIELYKLFFDHGIDTLLTPIFGPDLLERGDDYKVLMEQALVWFAQNQDFVDFYDEYDVRVRIYGDAQRYLQTKSYAHALDAYEELTRRTASHSRYRLFFGICAHDPAETIAEIGVRFYQEHGHLPNKQQIVESYYGEYIKPIDFFIGFDRPAAFDMPLIATGNEDLYFTVSPSPYLNTYTLRTILYDHLYARRVYDADYDALLPENWQILGDFYTLNRHQVLGLGRKHKSGNFWYPLPQVELPPHMIDE